MVDETEPVGPELLLTLKRGTGGPLHEQLERRLREHIRSGRLTPGARMPSSRALAAALAVSRGVVLEAYAQLSAEGYLTASQGAPTRVAIAPSAERPPEAATSLEPRYAYDFHPGRPDLAGFPRQSWQRSLRAAVRDAPFDALAGCDPRGAPELRNALMAYLGRARGAAAEPEHTLICAGFTQGFAVLCRALRERGLERIAIEDPGWAQHRLVAAHAGLQPVGIGVDEFGISVAQLWESGCEAVVVTPAHQFPTGVVFGAERRAELLEWAEDRDGLIVEDDYDSELRYDRDAVGALQGLAPERIVHIGSLSKRLAPALRVGWLLAPSWLSGALTYEKGVADGGSPLIDQLALAEFLRRGELDRHLRRMRLRYRSRREALLHAVAREIPGSTVRGIAAGLFTLVQLPESMDEDVVVTAAAAHGVGVEALSWHRGGSRAADWHRDGSGRAEWPGLVIGHANLTEVAIHDGVRLLARAVASAM